jgi:hypothetical protein
MTYSGNDYEYFRSHHDEIIKNHIGEYVVIRENSVMGYYKGMFDGVADMHQKKIPAGSYSTYPCSEKLPVIEVASVWTV